MMESHHLLWQNSSATKTRNLSATQRIYLKGRQKIDQRQTIHKWNEEPMVKHIPKTSFI